MTKEERALKEAASKLNFEERMRQLELTRPPSEGQLLEAVGAVQLSPAAFDQLPPLFPSVKIVEPPTEKTVDREGEGNVAPPNLEDFSASQRAAARVNTSQDPKLEALLDTIAQQVKAKRHQRSGLNPRVLVKVDSDTFSRVSNVAYSRRLDKIEVLSYLLSRYLPDAGREEPPAWLTVERPDDVLNSRHLVYQEDSEIAVRFTWLEQRFGLLKVDIVAAIVARHLPKSPFVVPPKHRPKRKRF
jgi:hypothetical protein